MKLLDVRVAAAIGLLNVADTWLLMATPVTMGVVADGEVAVTVGDCPTTGDPRIGSRLPPPQPATNAATTAGVHRTGANLKNL